MKSFARRILQKWAKHLRSYICNLDALRSRAQMELVEIEASLRTLDETNQIDRIFFMRFMQRLLGIKMIYPTDPVTSFYPESKAWLESLDPRYFITEEVLPSTQGSKVEKEECPSVESELSSTNLAGWHMPHESYNSEKVKEEITEPVRDVEVDSDESASIHSEFVSQGDEDILKQADYARNFSDLREVESETVAMMQPKDESVCLRSNPKFKMNQDKIVENMIAHMYAPKVSVQAQEQQKRNKRTAGDLFAEYEPESNADIKEDRKTATVKKANLNPNRVYQDRENPEWRCECCDKDHTLENKRITAPFTRIHNYKFEQVKDDGDCFYSSICRAFATINKNMEVRDLRRVTAGTVTESTLEHYHVQAQAYQDEAWLSRFRCANSSQDEPPSEAPLKKVKTETKTNVKPVESYIDTVEELKKFVLREGSQWGVDECMWADERAFDAVANHLNVTLLLVDMESDKNFYPYRVLAKPEGGESEYYVVLKREHNHFNYLKYLSNYRAVFTQENLPNAVRSLWDL